MCIPGRIRGRNLGPGRTPGRGIRDRTPTYTRAVITTGTRLGVLGGTFDPPHVGHLVAAVNVRHALQLDLVLLTVANRPWQKVGSRPLSAAVDRLAMVQAAVADVEGIEASSIELERGGDSFTIDTVDGLLAEDRSRELFVIVGEDAAAGMPSWERVDDLRKRARLVVVERPGTTLELPAGWEFDRVEVPRLEVSSTDLRARAVDGRPLDYLVPPGVISVMADRRLYRVACP